MRKTQPQKIELLAPARTAEIAIEAIRHGADAVYMGGPSHGARQAAANSLDDIARVVEYAHIFDAKVYVTVNTIIYDDEMPQVVDRIWQLYAIGVDAIIVQDLGLLKQHLPPIALHASTQCDIRTPERAKFLQDAGFSQLVLARELSLDEISEIRHTVDVPLEAFVHGALCVSYSGDCQASFMATGRSANRGECAQICRYKFDMETSTGHKLLSGKHLLSLHDLNRLNWLEEMMRAGVSSFKIEGRLKDVDYVKNIVAAYSRQIDRIISTNPRQWQRASLGRVEYKFEPDVAKSFNRGFTSYFFKPEHCNMQMASIDTPKYIGKEIGKVRHSLNPNCIIVDLVEPIVNGDGLGYFTPKGDYSGFRVNKIEHNKIFTASPIEPIKPGTTLYRNYDKKFSDNILRRDSANRIIAVKGHLRTVGDRIVLRLSIDDQRFAVAALKAPIEAARSEQTEIHRQAASKLGDTPFVLTEFIDEAKNTFIPASALTSLRREAANWLIKTIALTHDYNRSIVWDKAVCHNAPKYHQNEPAPSRHLNIANKHAMQFYNEATGIVEKLPMAIEVENPTAESEIRVMQTRYCLRRELGICRKKQGVCKNTYLKGVSPDDITSTLFLTSGNLRLRLEFDCRNCLMNVYTPNK